MILEGLCAAVVGVVCAAWVLRLWRGDLAVPLRYSPVDDTKFYLMLVKGIVDHGWYASNPSLGAPFGQQLVDYPQGTDVLNLLIIRFLALFSSDPALIVNLFFLGTFALCAFTAHLALRALGLSALSSGVAAVLFALLAYHFFRGESHLFLSAYYGVPLIGLLFLRVLDGEGLFARRSATGHRLLRWASGRTALTLIVCAVIGSDNLYYATFAVVMLLGGALIGALTGRRSSLLQGLLVVTLILATVTVNLAPSLIYRREHGTNVALERSVAGNESSNEAFSLRLSNLLLPAPDARIAPLRKVTERYDHAIAPGYCEACYASLGTVGDAGFIWLTLCALLAIAGLSALSRREAPAAPRGRRRVGRDRGGFGRRVGEPDRADRHPRRTCVEPDLGADRVLLPSRCRGAARRPPAAPSRDTSRASTRLSPPSGRCFSSASTTRPATPTFHRTGPPPDSGAATNGSFARSKRDFHPARECSSFPTFPFQRGIRKPP